MNPAIVAMALRALDRHEKALERNTVTLERDDYVWIDRDETPPTSGALAMPSEWV